MNEKFIWGAATAAYQIEGAAREDGRGLSIWDVFSHTPGRTFNGDTGDVACDHYHRYPEDVVLMQWMGLDAYRFSISWPRVLPDGVGKINSKGLAFYDKLVDRLLDAGIDPWITLFHWDSPQALEARGGMTNRDFAQWFAEYTAVVTNALGDRVKNWMTLNEPLCSAWFGYYKGFFAPGVQNLQTALNVSHHLLLAHGHATEVIRSNISDARVGTAMSLTPVEAASDHELDVKAAELSDAWNIRWFLDPIYGRGYPADLIEKLGMRPDVRDGDLEKIATPTDFLGVNYYFREVIASDPHDTLLGARGVHQAQSKFTGMDWEIHADGLYRLLKRLQRDYAPQELFITENGSAWPDVVVAGEVNDGDRTEYLQQHLEAVMQARSEGVPVNGYFAWSLLDNYEWASGYSKRFGLIYVDYATQKRIPKRTAHWYRNHISSQR
jgi:beta-glucosidase